MSGLGGLVFYFLKSSKQVTEKEISSGQKAAAIAAMPPNLKMEAGQDALADAQQLAAGLIGKALGNVNSNLSQIPGSVT